MLDGPLNGSSIAALLAEPRTADLTGEVKLRTQLRPIFAHEVHLPSSSSLKHLVLRRRHSSQALVALPRLLGVTGEDPGGDEIAYSSESRVAFFRRGVLGFDFMLANFELEGRFGSGVLAVAGLTISCEVMLLVSCHQTYFFSIRPLRTLTRSLGLLFVDLSDWESSTLDVIVKSSD